MGLQSMVIPVNEIDKPQILNMLQLMRSCYLDVDKDRFQADLRNKDKVILLYENGAIHGFSTWTLIRYEIEERVINIIFSGDTIIERNYRHSLALPIAWGNLMLASLSQYPDIESYWLLTSKGYKTYRFLPVFFHEFYPCFMARTPPFEKLLMNSFARHKFGSRFNQHKGILTASKKAQKLIPGVADISEARRKDPHIAFFEKMNPGYTKGDELVCIAHCKVENINPFILRFLAL